MAEPDPDTLERRIERTRAELAKTVDAIADRVSPKKVAGRSVAKVKSQVRAQTEQVVSTIGDMVGQAQSPNGHRPAADEPWDDDYPASPIAPVLIGIGVAVALGAAIVIMRRRRRR
ncbi:DUF3618 domain-containing protein [Herbidospora daliensis]|uniref:DUF3618 domain-containing protein n=1 Tax=Herbidospora daliensis TaxID=295585 RepID=UPI0007813160|nr:DUF3618 domain-containing protein [Herbidospora daliensis]